MNIQKYSLLFFIMPRQYFYSIECKNKLDIREGRQEQWKPTSTPGIFFFFHENFSYEHSEQFITICFYAVLVFLEKWMQKKKKKEEIREGRQEQWKPIFAPYICFLSQEFSYEHSERFQVFNRA